MVCIATTVNNNTAIGAFAFDAGTASDNTAVGAGALGGASNSAQYNVAVGVDTLNVLNTGTQNKAIGS